MKLGAIRSAIRKQKNVYVPLVMPGTGSGMQWVRVQKTDLDTVLKTHFGDDRTFETDLSIDGDGRVSGFPLGELCGPGVADISGANTAQAPDDGQVDLEDLLGGVESDTVDVDDLLG